MFSLMDYGSDPLIPPGWYGIRVKRAIVMVARYNGVPPVTSNGAVLLFNPAEMDANMKAIIDNLNRVEPLSLDEKPQRGADASPLGTEEA